MIQCLLLSGSLIMFSPDGDSMINVSNLTHLWKEEDLLKFHSGSTVFTRNGIQLEGAPVGMTLKEILAECDKSAWEAYNEVPTD